jgi:hypothetical protein
VTDPRNPEYLGELPGQPGAHLRWYDIKVYDDHAFIVSESNPSGMKVFDLTRLRDLSADDGPRTFDTDAFYPLPVAAHNLAINEDTGYAYIVGGNAGLVVPDQCRSGLHMVDIREPKSPAFAGCYLEEGGPGTAASVAGIVSSRAEEVAGNAAAYVHDTQCVTYEGPDEEHHDREICFNSSETHLSVVDVTDKLLPTLLGTVSYDDVAYTHQGWLTEDQTFFLLGDELDEREGRVDNTRTLVFDVRDLDAPLVHGEHLHETQAIDHNMYTRGHLLFQSNYEAGLRVLDTSRLGDGDPETPLLEEIAFFDVYPEADSPNFNGTWSNYPYFPSGTIAVTSYDGLFLLRLQPQVGKKPLAEGGSSGYASSGAASPVPSMWARIAPDSTTSPAA